VHAHIALWVHKDDVEQASLGVVACIPGIKNAAGHWVCGEGANRDDEDLLRLVLQHQQHVCREFLCMKNKKGVCSKRFPFDVQHERKPKENAAMGGLWTYFRPRVEDRNVVPYHASILLTWRAHMNIQRVTHREWTRYLLK
jgi:hypothetical protein